jgi:sugar lactone lactonase YvrE
VRPVSYVDTPVALGNEQVLGLAVQGGCAYFTTDARDTPSLRHTVRRLNLQTGAVSVFAGSVSAVDAPFEGPSGLCVSGNFLYVADTENSAVRRADLASGIVQELSLRRAP